MLLFSVIPLCLSLGVPLQVCLDKTESRNLRTLAGRSFNEYLRSNDCVPGPVLSARCGHKHHRLSLTGESWASPSHGVWQGQGHTVLNWANESPGPLTACLVFSPELRQWGPLPPEADRLSSWKGGGSLALAFFGMRRNLLRGSGNFLEWL